MEKRGQLTILLLIGILIVAVILILVFMLSQQEITPSGQVLPPLERIKLATSSTIESCLQTESNKAITTLGLQGGYISLPPDFLVTSYANLAYLYNEGNLTLPTIEDMESEINTFLTSAIPACTNFEPSRIITQPPQVTTTILNDSVRIRLLYQAEIILDDLTVNLNTPYTRTLDIRLGYLHSIVNEILQGEVASPGIDIVFLDNLDIKTTFQNVDESTVVYMLEDQKSNINEESYLFIFANKFNFGDLEAFIE